MSSIEQMISLKIQKLDPNPNAQAYDRKVIQLAYKDFLNYMKPKIKTNIRYCIEYKVEKIASEETLEFDAFLTVWIGMWIKKWQERVKLVIGRNNGQEKSVTVQKLENITLENDLKEEIINVVSCTLINNGEICGTEIIAENIINQELNKEMDITDKKQAVTFLQNIIQAARNTSKTTGPLMFIEINKAYYKSIANQ